MINRLHGVTTQQRFFSTTVARPRFQSAHPYSVSNSVQRVISQIQRAQDISIVHRQSHLMFQFTLDDTRYRFESIPGVESHDPYKGHDGLSFQKIGTTEKPTLQHLNKHEVHELHQKAFPTLLHRIAAEYGLGRQCDLTRLLYHLVQQTASKAIEWQTDPKIDNFLLRSLTTTLPDGTHIILEDAYNASHHALVLQKPEARPQTLTLHRKSELNALGLLQNFFNLKAEYAKLAARRAECDAEEARLNQAEAALIKQMKA